MTNEHAFLREDIRLDCKRCFDCGAFWAIESFRAYSAECPLCAKRARDDKNQQINKLQNQVAGLKGALKRVKKLP